MELKNSVVVDLNIYNDLRDFERTHRNNGVSIAYHSRYNCSSSYEYISNDDAVIKLTSINKENEEYYSEKISELREEIRKLKINPPIQLSIEDIKKLSFLKLIKWYFKK